MITYQRIGIDHSHGNTLMALLSTAAFDGTDYYTYLRDYQGNIRCVVRPAGRTDFEMVQQNHYYPYGLPVSCSTSPEANPYKYGSKHFDTRHGLNLYDFEARFHAPDLGRFLSPDPHASDYHDLSPYIFCAANPIRHIDPTGMDTYLINGNGNVVNRTDSKEDIFIIVNDAGEQMYDDEGNELKIVLPEGSVKYEQHSTKYGLVDVFTINNDFDGWNLFTFFADNITVQNEIEYSYISTGAPNNERNYISTGHLKLEEPGMTWLYVNSLFREVFIREMTHSHSKTSYPSPEDYDFKDNIINNRMSKLFTAPTFNIYCGTVKSKFKF